MPSERAAEPPASGETPAPGRMSRFARVFGALGGSRGSARPGTRETSTSVRADRLGGPAAPQSSTFREYSPLDNANARGGAAPRRDSRPEPAAAQEISGPRRGSRPAYPAEEPPTPGRNGPAGSAAGKDTPPSRSGRPEPAREGAAPVRDDRRAFADLPRSPSRTAEAGPGYPALGDDHPASDAGYPAFRGGDHAARGRRRPGAESGEPVWRPETRTGISGAPGGDPGGAGYRQNAESSESGWRPGRRAGTSGRSGGEFTERRTGYRPGAESGRFDGDLPEDAPDYGSGQRPPGTWGRGSGPADDVPYRTGYDAPGEPRAETAADRPGPGDPPPTKEYRHADFDPEYDTDGRRVPRKLTVTRVAAMRGKELTGKGIATFRRAAEADGADKSGLTALTYATMANFALDAAIAVALANTLFFASATAESKSKVALYLLITIAPFAIIAPLIGPALDRLQTGRRLALAASFAARAVVAVVLIFSMDSWVLYPLALCMMVLSKSFAVLKSAVTPRVLPPDIDLVRTNSRLTVFGLVGGTLGAGGVAGATAALTGSTGALILATGIAVGGAYLSWKIPRWVEITEGEVPATLGYHGHDPQTEILEPGRESPVPPRKRRQPLGRAVVTGLWGNGSIRVLTGFLTFYIAFVAKATEHRPVQQAAMLGLVGAAAAVGNFAGNATGARLRLGRPSLIVVNCTLACTVAAAAALLLDNLLGAALAALVAAAASALAKVSLDASIQDDLPPESIASGFGRSETVLQLSWVIGGAGGVLLPTDYWKGFAVVSAVLAVGLVQTVLSSRGHSLLPGLGGRRPLHAEQEIPHHDPLRGDAAR